MRLARILLNNVARTLPAESREAKKKRREEKRSREERRDSLETKQIDNPHFTGGRVKQNHKIVNIPVTILAKKLSLIHI